MLNWWDSSASLSRVYCLPLCPVSLLGFLACFELVERLCMFLWDLLGVDSYRFSSALTLSRAS
jgi:hypothetical protein